MRPGPSMSSCKRPGPSRADWSTRPGHTPARLHAQVLDRDGVGKLVEMATKAGKAVNPKLKVGVCGEQGGDPASIEFFTQVLSHPPSSPPPLPPPLCILRPR